MLVNSLILFIIYTFLSKIANCDTFETKSIPSYSSSAEQSTTVKNNELITLVPQANGLVEFEQLEKRKKAKSTSFTVNPTAVQGAVATDASYVDIYKCDPKSMNVTDVSGLSSSKYGCSNEAMVSYLINRGEIAVRNLTFIINENSTYVKYYNAYIREIQSSIMLLYGEWFQNTDGLKYFTCPSKKCESDHKHIFQKERLYKYTNMYINESMWAPALESMSTFLNLTLKQEDFTFGDGISYNISHVAFKNCTIPKAAVIVPNPMESVTTENITNLANLIETAKQSLGKASPLDLLEYLIPVVSYATVSDHAMQMYAEGQKEVKLEKKEREMKILEIVFACIGIASIAFGPLVAGIVGSVIAFADVFATWGITGKFSVNMLVSALVSVIFIEFSYLEIGAEIGEVVNSVRTEVGSVFPHLLSFPEWTKPMEEMFSLTFQTGVNAAVAQIPN